MSKKVILTGIRANNDLHIGNYFGALLPIIDMAKKHAGDYQINLFVPDLHSFTTPIDHRKLQEQIKHNLKLFVAAGLPLDNPDVHIYRQSRIPAHSELTWILSCFTGFGEMSRMIEFKDKSQKLGNDRTSVGLFTYPILQTADILLYQSSFVPVGEDQRQHIEFARDISSRFNNRFGDTFTLPNDEKEYLKLSVDTQDLRIRDLVDPSKKMSKSEDSHKGIIFLGDDPKAAAKKIMGATSDSIGEINYDIEKQPGVSNLLQILALLNNQDLETVTNTYRGQTQYGELKKAVAEAVESFLEDFQSRLAQVDEDTLQTKLESSEVKMNEIANATLLRVQKAVGLR